MYYNQSMKVTDEVQFSKAVIKEVNGQITNTDSWLFPRRQVPKDHRILPPVWDMINNREI